MKTEEAHKPPIKRQQRAKATAATTGTSRRGRGSLPPVVEAGLMPESELKPLVSLAGLLEPEPKTTAKKGRSRKGLGSPAGSSSTATPAKGKSRRSGPNNNNNPSAQLPSASPPSVNTRTRTTAEGPDGGGSSGGANNSPIPTRRIFTPAFKRAVLNAFASDPECIGNQRATARKFGVHRRQVQKWLRQDTDSLDKDKESSSDEPHPNSEDRPLNSQDSTVIPEKKPSKTENSRVISPSSSPSSSQVDLCEMSTAAMALSLNLSMNSNNAGMESRLSGNNKHPSSASTGVPMPSPTTLLSKYYGLGLALNPNGISSPSSFQKYEPPNLNTNKNPSKPRTTHNSANNAKTRINGNNQNQHPFYPPTPTNNNQLQPSYFNVDEVAAMYPHQDFDLLRQAVLRNEVTFTKFQGPGPESSLFPPSRSGINKFKNNSSRCSSSSPSPPDMTANRLSDMYPAQAQALEMLRQQSEYVKLFQQAGINFPGLAGDSAAYAAGETMKNKSKNAWVHPLLAQASATSGYQGLNGHRKVQPQEHIFVSPKIPTPSSKPKTVAAALAASRLSPNSLLSNMTGNMFEPLLAAPPSKRKPAIPAQRKRKPKVTNPPNSAHVRPDEDYLDPTSILEVTTSSGSDGNNSINGVDRNGGAGNYPYMNGNHFMAPNIHSPNNGFGEFPASKLQNYLEQNNVSSPEASSPPTGETDQDKIKNLALQAFTYDPEVAGDARAVARKHGLNARVVMKWIKESSSKSFPMLNPGVGLDAGSAPLKINGTASILEGIMASYMSSLEPNNLTVPNPTHKTNGDSHPGNHTFTPSSSNKRKNSKPNQICDFMQDDDDNVYGHEALDMMIPIKKRRVSTQQ